MSCVNADYSNTIFYKIFCKDPSIKDLYIGHTTNFVQRKHAHKQSCINPKSSDYHRKLYKCIRDNLGWDNWRMEIIGFHNCEDLHSAKVQEQLYFEEYKATLNSIEPLPKRKPKNKNSIKLPKEKMYCNVCNTRTSQEEQNERLRHVKTKQAETKPEITNNTSFTRCNCELHTFKRSKKCEYICDICEYTTNNKYDYSKHLLTPKHKTRSSKSILGQKITPDHNALYVCSVCDKHYKSRNGLWYHEKKCKSMQNNSQRESVLESKMVDASIVIELLKQNQEFKNMMIEQQQQLLEYQQKSLEYQQKSDHRYDQLIEAVKNGKFGNITK